jgi:hypothetical protein
MERKKPLYRTVNTRTHGVRHRSGGDFAWERNSKRQRENQSAFGSMHGKERRGLDYTPLFKFLLSRIGENWPKTYSEAVERIDRPNPIFWIVAESELDRQAVVRVGENTYYSGLYVNENNTLAAVDPSVTEHDLNPTCQCCTHTFNGKRFTRPYQFGADYPGKAKESGPKSL